MWWCHHVYWTFTDACNRTKTHTQTLTVTPVPVGVFDSLPPNMTVDCADIPTSAPNLNYDNGESGACAIAGTVAPVITGSANLCGGTITNTWTFTDVCGRVTTHVQTINVTPVPEANFDSLPPSLTITCAEIPTTAPNLSFTNGLTGACLIAGNVTPTITGSADLCGGAITHTWSFTDACGRTKTHVRTLTVIPVPEADWVNAPPTAITVDCYNIPTSAPPLQYTNGLTGSCLISGTVIPVMTGSANECSGTITFTWTFTDPCNRIKTHIQTVTVTPTPPAAFVNPPASIVVDCYNIPTGPPALQYTNGETGNCGITGTVAGTQTGSANMCGGVIQYAWTFTDQCGRNIQHFQTITVTPTPAAQFVNPPPGFLVIECDEIPSGAPDLQYTNGETGSCEITGTVSPVITGSAGLCGGTINYTWTFTDQCGRIIQHVQTLVVNPAPEGDFQNPPASITVDCANIPGSAPALTFTNGLGGNCGIFSSVPAQLIGFPDPCGSQYSYSWTFTDACGRTKNHTQFITVTPTPQAQFTNPPLDITVTCDQVTANMPALQYTNNQAGNCSITGSVQGQQTGSYDYCGGTLFNTWTFTDDCNRTITHTQTVTVLPAPPAVFQNLPADITVTCDNIPGPDQALNYSNGQNGTCSIQGSILPSESGTWDACGGYKEFEWFFQDDCGRTIQHTQTVTILKGPDPVFVSPPADETISCGEAEQLSPSITISYTNYAFGDCENSGTVEAFADPTYNECGGTIIYTWDLDACGKTITHTQVFTVEPVADPVFVAGPPDLTLECGEPLPPLVDLYYFNNQFGICEIEGFVLPTVTEVDHVWTITWEYTNPCTGNVIQEKQIILEKPDPIMQVNPDTVRICLGESFNLSTLQVVDLNNAKPSISYHTGTPATAANQLSNTTVSPVVNTIYYIKGTTVYGCVGEVPFTLIVDQPVTAGGDGSGYLCNGATNVNLFTYIGGSYTPGGTWIDPNNSGIDIFPPTNVSFAGAPAGVYTFKYVIPSNGACEGDTSTVVLTHIAPINILIDSLVCESSQDFYNVYFTLNTFVPTISIGTLANLGNGKYSVSAIPVDSSLTIVGTDPGSGCLAVVVIDPPNCNCPPVPNPVNLDDPSICQGDPIPTLNVTVGPGDIANWYSAPNGGTLLQANSTSYTPVVSNPGVYIYYVEAVNAMFPNCKSPQRTPVELTILQKPVVQNGILKSCDANNDGLATFTLSNANAQVNGNPNNMFVYYGSAADAQNGVNPLPNNYTSTVPYQQTIYVVVTNQAGCKSQAQVSLIVFPMIQLTTNVTGVTCLGDNNGSVVISSTGGTGNVTYSLTNSNYTSQTTYNNLAAGVHTVWAKDTFNCIVSQPFTVPAGLELTISSFTVVCNNNNTPSDATDDFYTITFTLTNNQANAGTFSVTGPGVNQGPYTYGQSHNFTLPANGQSLTLTFTDAIKGCPVTQQIGPLNSCSTDCQITITTLTKICNDAGTNSDPVDDYYVFTVNATAVNAGPSNSFIVVIGGNNYGPFTYGTGGTFNIPANGTNPVATFIDNDDAQCSASQSTGPLTPCSNTCLITAVVDSIKCDGLGTENDIFDDVFTFQVTVSGLNKSTSWYVSPNSGTTYPYDVAQTFGPYLISNGVVTLTLVDSADPNCTFQIQVTPPPPCSEPCELVVVNLNEGPCNNNNTGPNVNDDFFAVSFTVNAVLGTTSQYEVTWNGTTWGPFNYGVNVNLPNVPANGQTISLTITDITNPACVTTVDVMKDPCSFCNQTAEAGPTFEIGCATPNVILQGSANPANGMYSWTGPNNFTSMVPTPVVGFPGTYILTVTYADQCVAVDSTVVTVDQSIPVADAGPNVALTCIVSSVTLGGPLTSMGPNYIYIWKDASGTQIGNNPTLTVTQPGTYTLQVIDFTNNCSSPIDQVVVVLDQQVPLTPIYTNPAATLGCLVDTVTLSTDPQPDVVFTWTQGGNTLNGTTFIVTSPGLITLTAVDTVNGCSGASQITINDETDIPLVNNGVLKSCDPDGDGLATFNLASANQQINTDPTNTFTYHLTQADALAGGNGLPVSYTTVTPGQQVIYVRVANAIGCFDVASLTLIVFPPIVLQTTVTGETCLGDDNGSVTLSSTGGTGQVSYSLTNSNYSAQTVYGSLAAGTHTAWAQDTFGCTVSQPFTVPGGLDLTLDNLEAVCNDNGTVSDATDDFYVITFTVSNNQANAGTFSVTGTGVNEGPFTYGVSHSFTIPANGQSLTLTLADVIKGCSLTEDIGPLNTCSTNCKLTITTLTKVCDDNGTDYDPADDFYTFTVNATALNPGASGTFVVVISGNTYGPFTYGTGGTFTIPANGTNPVVTLRDADDSQCFASQSAGALIPCSDKCLLNALVANIVCDKNATDNDPLDDTYDFEITVTGFNNSTEWYVDPNSTTVYPYGVLQNFGPYLIANGQLVLTLVDSNDPTCTTQVTITPPPPCSEPCEIEVVNLNLGPCNNNNTGPNDTDDFFPVSFTVNSILGVTSQFEVTWNTLTWGPFNYGSPVTLPNVPANGQLITLQINDLNNPNCFASINVTQDPCSECNQTAEAGPGFILDCTIQTATLSGSANPAGGSFLWSGPNAFSSTSTSTVVNFPGMYVLTVTYPDQCTAADSTLIGVDASVPIANAGPNRILTCKIDSVYLDGSNSSVGSNLTYIWKDPSGQVISNATGLWVTLPGNYTLQVINTDNNCSSLIDIVTVSENKALPVAPIMADPGELLNCVVDNVLLFTDPQPGIVFTWDVGGTKINGLQTIVSEAGLIILTAVDTATGCIGTSQIIIEDQTEYPIVKVTPPGSLNCVNTTVVIDASTSQSGPNIIFTWFDENGTVVQSGTDKFLSVTNAGEYILEVADTSNGCANMDTVVVITDVDFPTVDAGPEIKLPCDIYSTGITAVGSNYGSTAVISWSSPDGVIVSGGNTFNPQVNGTGWYFIDLTNGENGCLSRDSVYVKGNADAPDPDVEIDPIACKGDNDGAILVGNIQGGTPPYTIQLNGEIDNSGQFTPLGPGTYNLKITDAKNCKYDTTIVIVEGNDLFLSLSTNSILIVEGDSAILEAIVNIPSSEIGAVVWSPGTFLSCDSCLITKVVPLNTQEYKVTVTDPGGCSATDYLIVVVKKDTKVYIPNAFSPDGDIINDNFTLYGDDKVKRIISMKIFDRWGGLMFQGDDIPPNDPQFG
ncbi:MAG: gliding motility-associated C-terminal domain-containing protein [Saprospiraceae bacterium]|nr:gliding motility-associated C-terminal domain-containing protein [Saprospiraceae bacterium]